MNDRIKKLAEQAGFGEQWFEEHSTGCSLPKPLMLKEYTELIVREVLAVQEQFIAEGHNAWHLNKPTKQHFGVEE